MLIGEPGVGKTAVVEGLAQRVVAGDVPDLLKGRWYFLDLASMVAGAKYRGEFEERLKVQRDQGRRYQIITFIDELHTVVGAGASEGAMDASNMLADVGLWRAAHDRRHHLDEYRERIEKDPALAVVSSRFTSVVPSVEDTVAILRGLRERYEAHHKVRITDGAPVAAATLSNRYISNRQLPTARSTWPMRRVPAAYGDRFVLEEIDQLRRQVDRRPWNTRAGHRERRGVQAAAGQPERRTGRRQGTSTAWRPSGSRRRAA